MVVTLPAALAAGIRHLRRYLNADESRQRQFWRDYLKALSGGLAVGLGASAMAVILVADILLANLSSLPGGVIFAAVGWIGLIAVGVSVLMGSACWNPDAGWAGAVRAIPTKVWIDPVGSLSLGSTVIFVGVATWALVPMILPSLGLAVLAVVAIPERRSRRFSSTDRSSLTFAMTSPRLRAGRNVDGNHS
ncbi:hypothetical protein [Microbacterium pumilum]|uniref:Uncharacterized protein n=1 Tax=Microbacterium pumilum TaxID=344165 RepID=A0ABP5EI06_9MICO